MSGDSGPNSDQVERFLADLNGLPADAWGEVVRHAAHVAGAPMYARASERLVLLIRESGRVGEAMAADLQTLEAINAAPGLQQLGESYRNDERLLTAATNATKATIFGELLTRDEVDTLRYPFDMVLKPELRELSRKLATPSRGCLPMVALVIAGILLVLRSGRRTDYSKAPVRAVD